MLAAPAKDRGRPPPPTPPHKGEGSTPCLRHGRWIKRRASCCRPSGEPSVAPILLQEFVAVVRAERLRFGDAAGLLEQREVGLPVRRLLPAERLALWRGSRHHRRLVLAIEHLLVLGNLHVL